MKMNFLKLIASSVSSALKRLDFKFSIGAKITVVIILATLLAMLPSLVVSQRILSKSLEDAISARLTSDTHHKMEILTGFLSEKLNDLEIIARADNAILPSKKYSIEEKVAYLKDFMEGNESYTSLSIYNAQGVKIGDTGGWDIGSDGSQEQFFQRSISGYVYFDGVPFILKTAEDAPILRISVPIESEPQKVEAVLLANISLKEIESMFLLSAAANLPMVEFYLMNQDGIVIAPSRSGQNYFENMRDWDVFKLFKITGKSQFVHTTAYKGEERLFAGAKSQELLGQPGLNWFLLASIPTKEIFMPITNAEIGIMIIAIGFLLLIMPFSVFIAETLTEPIYLLMQTAKKISEGEFDQQIDVSSKDEIGELAKSFREMMFKLKDSYSSLESKNRELSQTLVITENKQRALKDAQQAVLRAFGDVEKQKELFQRQLVETKKFKQAVDFSTDAIFITDRNAQILYANQAWEKLNGYSIEEALGRNPNLMKSGKTPVELYENMWKIISKGEVFVTEDLINKRKNGGEYEARLTVFPIKEGDQVAFFVGVEQDITERKIIERSKTEFVSIASHQLRTPLTTINLFTEMLQKGDAGSLNKKQSEYIYHIRHSIKRMINLVNDLLNVSRIETGRLMISPKPVYLEDVIDDAVKGCRFLLRDKLCKLEFNRPKSKLPAVMIDENLLHQVLYNLVVNAITYSPSKRCKITVTLSRRSKENDYLISVKDEGIGIPEEARSKLFEKFFRADNAIKMTSDGTGLGLYLVRMVMSESGGNVWFESPAVVKKTEAGKEEKIGSIFYLSIPFDGMKEKVGEKTLEIV